MERSIDLHEMKIWGVTLLPVTIRAQMDVVDALPWNQTSPAQFAQYKGFLNNL